MALLIVLASVAGPWSGGARADSPLTWYASTTNSQSFPGVIAGDGVGQALAYNSFSDPDSAQAYLDAAQAAGVKVILDVGWLNVRDSNFDPVRSYVERFADHPALAGWYLFDEPDEFGLTVSEAETGAAIVRSFSDKPIYGAIDSRALRAQDNYRDTIDRVVTFDYPFDVGDEEFGGSLESNWKSRTAAAAANARDNGQPWYHAIQAYGRETDSQRLRLPTEGELRFMTFYSLVAHDAAGVMFWARYRTTRSAALPDEPFPGGGFLWLRDVFQPMAGEFEDHFGDAVDAGALGDAVSSSDPGNIHADVFRDPDTGKYYLLVVNDEGRQITATLTLDLGLEAGIQDLLPIGGGSPVLVPDNGEVGLTLSQYATRSFEVRLVPEPAAVGLLLLPGLLLTRRTRHK